MAHGDEVCPLGLCRLETVCPHAPCLECMARLKEHMLGELEVLERQSHAAGGKGDTKGQTVLGRLLDSLAGLIERPRIA